MSQLDMFAAPAPEPTIPEAIVNTHGVMVGNLIRHHWTPKSGCRDEVEILFGHVGGSWSYSVSISASHCYGGGYPSAGRATYKSFDDAVEEAYAEAMERLTSFADRDWDDLVRRAGKRLADCFTTTKPEETTKAEL